MQQLYGEEKINTGDECFHEDNRTFSLSYQVYVYDYIYIVVNIEKILKLGDRKVVFCYNHLELYKQQVLVIFDEK